MTRISPALSPSSVVAVVEGRANPWNGADILPRSGRWVLRGTNTGSAQNIRSKCATWYLGTAKACLDQLSFRRLLQGTK